MSDWEYVPRDSTGWPARAGGTPLYTDEEKATFITFFSKLCEELRDVGVVGAPLSLWVDMAKGTGRWSTFGLTTPEQFTQVGWTYLYATVERALRAANIDAIYAAGYTLSMVETRSVEEELLRGVRLTKAQDLLLGEISNNPAVYSSLTRSNDIPMRTLLSLGLAELRHHAFLGSGCWKYHATRIGKAWLKLQAEKKAAKTTQKEQK
jgi:hypothetical protein